MTAKHTNGLMTGFLDQIVLHDMEKVKLMNRMDTKYWFEHSNLQSIIDSINSQYYLLHIVGKSQMTYATTYFDTNSNSLYGAHHNGKLNRYKIRKRIYMDSGIAFLEIKFKNNKGKTRKTRIPTAVNNMQLSNEDMEFIQSRSPYKGAELSTSLTNEFTRITLVNKNFKERCTIDTNISYMHQNKRCELKNLVIVEIKSEGKPCQSPLVLALRNHRLRASGFSKYCVGRTLTDSSLKSNSFKKKIRMIEKVTNTDLVPSQIN